MPNAIDANSNVYSTGYAGTAASADLLVLKYDSLGTLQYSLAYNNGGFDNGDAITVDASGNAYVAGTSYDVSTGLDYVIIKISPSGSQLWVKRFDGGVGAKDDLATAICTDVNGNIFVTGKSQRSSGDYDIVSLRLDATTGTIVWTNGFNGSSNRDDVGVGLVASDNGQYLYITGNTTDAVNGSDIVTYALDISSGSVFWSPVITNGTANSNDKSNAIILWGTNIAICGELVNSSSGLDYTTITYDGNTGSIIWQQNYDFSGTANRATALARDSAGNLGVTGTVLNGSAYSYHTVLYANNGTQYAVNVENTALGTLLANPRIANDTIAHHWYVSGEKAGATTDMLIYQITPTGNTSWKKIVDGHNNADAATGIAVNGIGVVYVTGMSKKSSTFYDYTTLKINQTPVYLPMNYNFVSDTFSFSHLFYPNTGEILDTAGNPANEVLFYTKFTYPNQYVLKDRVAFCEFHKDTATSNPKDSLSRVDLVFSGANPLADVYPVNLQQSSYLNYYMSHTGPTGKTNVQGAAQLFVPNIYPSIDLHYTSNAMGAKYFFVLKPGARPGAIRLNLVGASSSTLASGNRLLIQSALGSWSFDTPKIYNVALNFTTMALSTTTVSGAGGWVNLGGSNYGINAGTYSAGLPLVIEIDQGTQATATDSLNCNWSTYVGGGNDDAAFAVASAAGTNDLVVVGLTNSNNFPIVTGPAVFQNQSAGSADGYMELYDPTGQRRWCTFLGGAFDDLFTGVAIAPNGNIFAVGQAHSPLITISKLGATNYTVPLGYGDAFIFEVQQSGQNPQWLTYYGGNGSDIPTACKFAPGGDFYMIGNTNSTDIPVLATAPPQYSQTNNDPTTNQTDGFIARYDDATYAITWATYLGGTNSGAIGGVTDALTDLDIDSSDNLYVVGRTYAADYPTFSNGLSTNYTFGGNTDGVISMFTNGEMVWSTYFGSTGYDYCNAVKATSNKLYVGSLVDPVPANTLPLLNSGNWYYSATPGTAMFSEFDVNSVLQHSTFFSGLLGTDITDMEMDAAGSIYISGITTSAGFPAPLTQPSGAYVKANQGGYDNFLFALSPGGTDVSWATQVGGTANEGQSTASGASYVSINGQNVLHLVGSTLSSGQFPLYNGNGVPYFDPTINGGSDASVTRFILDPVNGVGIRELKLANSMAVYPNPTPNSLTVTLDGFYSENAYFYVYNTAGQLIMTGKLFGPMSTLNFSPLSPGLYILKIKDTNGSYNASVKFIKNE